MGEFRKVLRELRKKYDLTQDALADKLGTSKSTISMYENGKREPDFETLEAIADFFNVDMNYLLGKCDSTTSISTTWQPSITPKDRLDIAKEVEALISGLDAGVALSFDGSEGIDDTTKELLRKSLENTLETARLIAKEKYTPDKYKK